MANAQIINVTPAILNELALQSFPKSDIKLHIVEAQHRSPIAIYSERLGQEIELSPEQAKVFIIEWAKENNYSINPRLSPNHILANILAQIGDKENLEAEAAASSFAIRDRARAMSSAPIEIQNSMSSSLRKSLDLLDQQIKSYEKTLFDPLTHAYYNSPLLANIKDSNLKLKAATALAANPTLTSYSGLRATDQIIRTLSLSNPELLPLIVTAHSDKIQQDTESTLNQARVVLQQNFAGNNPSGIDYKAIQQQVNSYQKLVNSQSNMSTLSGIISSLHDSGKITATDKELAALDSNLRKLIVTAAQGQHISGNQIIDHLVKQKVISQDAANQIRFLAPQIDLAEIGIRTKITQNPEVRKRSRESWSAGIAANFGLDPSTIWIKDKELKAVSQELANKHGVTIDQTQQGGGKYYQELKAINTALENELGKGSPDTDSVVNLLNLRDLLFEKNRYYEYKNTDSMFAIEELFNKVGYNYRFIKDPYDRFSHKFWSKYDRIDEIINYPTNQLYEFWDGLKTGEGKMKFFKREFSLRVPPIVSNIIDFPNFIYGKYINFQKGIALRTFKWSSNLARRGGVYTPFKLVASYSKAFFKVDGSFYEANHYLGRKVMGNFLNWGAKRFGYDSFAIMKTSIGKSAGKFAFSLGNKITGGLLGKATSYIASLGLSIEGIGLVILATQLTIDLAKNVGKFIKKFIQDDGFRLKTIAIGTTISGLILGIGTLVSGVPAAIALGFGGLISFLGLILGGIASLFISAMLWAGSILAGFMIFYNLFKTSVGVDPGVGIFTAIVCNQEKGGSETTSDPTANAALCIAQVLNDCKLNPLTSSNVRTPAWQCVAAALLLPGANQELETSATSQGHLQCVGLSAASAAGAGAGFSTGQINACSYASSVPQGYKYLPGCPNMQPGDHFIMGVSGCNVNGPGHIGVVINPGNGALFTCVDANYGTSGRVRIPPECQFAKSQISGCLRKSGNNI